MSRRSTSWQADPRVAAIGTAGWRRLLGTRAVAMLRRREAISPASPSLLLSIWLDIEANAASSDAKWSRINYWCGGRMLDCGGVSRGHDR